LYQMTRHCLKKISGAVNPAQVDASL